MLTKERTLFLIETLKVLVIALGAFWFGFATCRATLTCHQVHNAWAMIGKQMMIQSLAVIVGAALAHFLAKRLKS